MGIGYRKTFKFGPFRFVLTHRGLSINTGIGPVRVGKSLTSKRKPHVGVNLPGGFSWRKR